MGIYAQRFHFERKQMSIIKAILVEFRNKNIGYAEDKDEVERIISMHFNKNRAGEYRAFYLKDETTINTESIVAKLKYKARAKPIKQKSNRIRRNDIIDDKYSKWLGQQPCVITGRKAERGAGANNMHCHHIHGRTPRNDYMQVPLMGFVHSWGNDSYHSLSKSDFIERHGLMIDDILAFFENHATQLKDEYDKK